MLKINKKRFFFQALVFQIVLILFKGTDSDFSDAGRKVNGWSLQTE